MSPSLFIGNLLENDCSSYFYFAFLERAEEEKTCGRGPGRELRGAGLDCAAPVVGALPCPGAWAALAPLLCTDRSSAAAVGNLTGAVLCFSLCLNAF